MVRDRHLFFKSAKCQEYSIENTIIPNFQGTHRVEIGELKTVQFRDEPIG